MVDSIVTPLLLAFVVGLDAFSVCLGIGLQPLRLKRIASIGLSIGFFHMLMPLLGILIGSLLVESITHLAELLSGLLLFGLGAYMIFQTFAINQRTIEPKKLTNLTIMLLAFSVSLDSFPVGISLGMFGFHASVTILLFCGVSTLMAWVSLLIGKKIQRNLDRSLAWVGGAVLCILGLVIIFL